MLHRIFIPPNQNAGFLFHRPCVEEYLSHGKSLSPFGSSKKMIDISANAAAEGKVSKKNKAALQWVYIFDWKGLINWFRFIAVYPLPHTSEAVCSSK